MPAIPAGSRQDKRRIKCSPEEYATKAVRRQSCCGIHAVFQAVRRPIGSDISKLQEARALCLAKKLVDPKKAGWDGGTKVRELKKILRYFKKKVTTVKLPPTVKTMHHLFNKKAWNPKRKDSYIVCVKDHAWFYETDKKRKDWFCQDQRNEKFHGANKYVRAVHIKNSTIKWLLKVDDAVKPTAPPVSNVSVLAPDIDKDEDNKPLKKPKKLKKPKAKKTATAPPLPVSNVSVLALDIDKDEEDEDNKPLKKPKAKKTATAPPLTYLLQDGSAFNPIYAD
jgi:hypothetical protein